MTEIELLQQIAETLDSIDSCATIILVVVCFTAGVRIGRFITDAIQNP